MTLDPNNLFISKEKLAPSVVRLFFTLEHNVNYFLTIDMESVQIPSFGIFLWWGMIKGVEFISFGSIHIKLWF